MRVDSSSARAQVHAAPKPEVGKAKTESAKMQAAKPEAKPAPQVAKHTRVNLLA
jgi:hypothetical protein